MIGFQGVRRPSKAEYYAAHPFVRTVDQIMAASPFQKTRFYGYSYETNRCMLTYSQVRFDNGAVRRVPMDRCGL